MQDLTQKTLVLIKPDAMKRGLSDEIVARIEKIGLKVVERKEVQASEDVASKHYPDTEEWLGKVGNNTLGDCEKYGFDPVELLGTKEPLEIGKLILQYNKEFLMSGPILALVFEGPHAVELIRKLVGATLPILASPGTIRGDYSGDSAILATLEKRSVYNLIHASGDPDEAKREIALWFGQ